MIYPSTATLDGDGNSTATLAQSFGFGTGGFGVTPFGGWVITVDAVITGASPGTATLMEAPVFAEIQLV